MKKYVWEQPGEVWPAVPLRIAAPSAVWGSWTHFSHPAAWTPMAPRAAFCGSIPLTYSRLYPSIPVSESKAEDVASLPAQFHRCSGEKRFWIATEAAAGPRTRAIFPFTKKQASIRRLTKACLALLLEQSFRERLLIGWDTSAAVTVSY